MKSKEIKRQVAVRIEPDIFRDIEKEAKKKDRTISYLINKALRITYGDRMKK